jgi:RNA polymerase sigma factor (sigma-70 family)
VSTLSFLRAPLRALENRRVETRAELGCSEELLVPLVYRQMRLMVGPHPDLDDLVQSALEQVLRAHFKGQSQFSTFTNAICYRVWMQHLRFSYRFRARIQLTLEGSLPEQTDDHDLAEGLEANERHQRLYRALNQVPTKLRVAVVLHDLGGAEIEEIAEIISAKPNTVRSRLRDGRKALGRVLRDDSYFGENACMEDLR